jgi:hypothetical protein
MLDDMDKSLTAQFDAALVAFCARHNVEIDSFCDYKSRPKDMVFFREYSLLRTAASPTENAFDQFLHEFCLGYDVFIKRVGRRKSPPYEVNYLISVKIEDRKIPDLLFV